jgi:hypothetical protein
MSIASSLQPTASPTAADAQPPVPPTVTGNPPISTTTNTVQHKALDTPNDGTATGGMSLKDKAAALLPAGALTAAAAYLRKPLSRHFFRCITHRLASYLNPTAADAQPASASAPKEEVAPSDVAPTASKDVNSSEATQTDKALPIGVLAAAGAYLRAWFLSQIVTIT